jgi:hypothetical protein
VLSSTIQRWQTWGLGVRKLLGFCQVSVWFYSTLYIVASDPSVVIPTNREQQEWNAKWLSIHCLKTLGNAVGLRRRVKHYMLRNGGPPPLLQPRGGSIKNVIYVVSNLHAMVSRLMSSSVTESLILDIDCHIKLFLSSYDTFDKEMRCDSSTPTRISSHNFICLSNLPDAIREFDPLQNLWEEFEMITFNAEEQHCIQCR